MRKHTDAIGLASLLLASLTFGAQTPAVAFEPMVGKDEVLKRLMSEMSADKSDGTKARLARGLEQVARLWRLEDGDEAAFEAFVRRNFVADPATLDALFDRSQAILEEINGHMNDISVALRLQSDLDRGPIFPFDETLAAYDPGAHLLDDAFANRFAFTILLNFPLTTLEQRLADGSSWTRRQWAEARLAQRYSRRIPADANTAMSAAVSRAEQYIADYNIWMHHLVDADGKRPFPRGMRLLSHWNLRDEIKAQYAGNDAQALARQRMIERVMERIVKQTIPRVAVNGPHVDWNPFSNAVTPTTVDDAEGPAPAGLEANARREPDTRYEMLLGIYHAATRIDAFSPSAPTLIARRFEEDREIPETRVKAMFEEVLSSPLVERTAGLIRRRLRRPLEPFDIWYNGFRPRGTHTQDELDAVTRKRYPTPAAYEADIPRMLVELGFDRALATRLAANIVVEPARGSGHAWGADRRGSRARLRTRVGKDGMDYKGFNIAVHEMGHNVEQTLSLNDIDHNLLHGVPNNAFTEALAFVFQERDLQLLGLSATDSVTESMQTLDAFWGTVEIAAVGLVDMSVWHWMYDHPDATPAELRAATIQIARDVWNSHFGRIFRKQDSVLLGIYSHMINSVLYLPDYPIGHMIAFQVGQQMKKAGSVGPEFVRMVAAGNVAPDLWMTKATGAPVGPAALLSAAERALVELEPEHIENEP